MKTFLTATLLALAIAACGSSGTSTAPTTAPSDAATNAPSAGVSLEPSADPGAAIDGQVVIVKDFTLDPIDVTSGTSVVLAVTNEGPTLHNIAIRDEAGNLLGTTKDLREGESETLSVELAAGNYILFCSLPGHESLGIKGTLTVE